MTKEEASRNYRIPISVLDEYENWGLCGSVKQVMGHWQYDEQDLERLSLIYGAARHGLFCAGSRKLYAPDAQR